jgi:rare lipoprotein A
MFTFQRFFNTRPALLLASMLVLLPCPAIAECGIASTYSSGSRTANGEAYNHMGVSAAHKTLPFGSRVVVRNQRTGRSIVVRINDRGPFIAGRIIDLSTGAKNALGMDGLDSVCLEVLQYGGKVVRTPRDFAREALELARVPVREAGTVVRKVRFRVRRAVRRVVRDLTPRRVRHHRHHHRRRSR